MALPAAVEDQRSCKPLGKVTQTSLNYESFNKYNIYGTRINDINPIIIISRKKFYKNSNIHFQITSPILYSNYNLTRPSSHIPFILNSLHILFSLYLHLPIISEYILSDHMQDKLKRKADKLTKQSFALLDRIKQRKEKKAASSQNEENYIDDLYLKVIGKCSPHFDKIQTSNQIFQFCRQQQQQLNNLRIENQMKNQQCKEYKEQIARLKESKDQIGRIKALNQEISMLEDKVQKLNQQIKLQMQLRVSKQEEIRLLKEEHLQLKSTNEELEDIVQKLSAELEAIAVQQTAKEEPKMMARTVSGEMQSTKSENHSLKAQNQQLIKQKAEISEKFYRLEKDLSAKTTQIKTLQQKHQKIIAQLSRELQRLQSQNKQINETLRNTQQLKTNSQSHAIELENVHKKLLKTELELANFKKQQQKIHSQNLEKSKKYQTQKSSYVTKINELSYNYELKQKQLFQLKQTYESEIGKQNKGIYKLNQNILQLQSQLTEHKQQKAKLQAKIDTLQQKCFQLQTLTGVLRTELDSTVTNADLANRKISEKENHFKEKNQQVEDKIKVIETKDKQINQLTRQIEKINKQKQKLKIQISKLNEQLSVSCGLHEQVKASLLKQKKERQTNATASASLRQQYETKLQEVSERCKFFKEANEALNNQKVDLINSIQMLAQEIKSLNDQLESQRNKYMSDIKNKEKQAQLQRLREQISSLKKQLDQIKCQKANQSVQEQLLLQISDKVEIDNLHNEKVSKHIETIKELTHELTEAYNTIGALEAKVKQFENGGDKKVEAKKSPDTKQRGKSLKKFFGF